jgi:hypothetical protein
VLAIANGAQPNTIPRTGGGPGAPGFFNAQAAAAVADAGDTLFVGPVGANVIPSLSRTALALLVLLLGVAAMRALRRR